MLRISKLADYGTVVMVYLARQAEHICNARDIANATNISVPMVSKLLKRLGRAGLLVSVRGASGGYRLSRSPLDISLAEIIYALESQKGLTECSGMASACALESVCKVQGNWRLINQIIENAFASISLATFAKPMRDVVAVDVK